MAKVLINQSTLTSIANAIRTKNGLTREYKPSEMPAAILAIAGSGGGGGYIPGRDLESYIRSNVNADYLYIPAEYADEDGTLYVKTIKDSDGIGIILSNLRKLEFGEGIKKIVQSSNITLAGRGPFDFLSNCKIIFPSTIKELYGGFRAYSPKDGTLELPEGLEVVENKAFGDIAGSTIILPSTIRIIGDECFSAYNDHQSYNIYIKGKPDTIAFSEDAFSDDLYDYDGTTEAAYQYFFVSWSKSALTIPTSLHRTITYNYEF